MRKAAQESHALVRRIPYAKLARNRVRVLALERTLEVLGESARRVHLVFQRTHPEIDWRGIIGQRNVIAHEYGEIDHRQLYEAARTRVPALIAALDRILGED